MAENHPVSVTIESGEAMVVASGTVIAFQKAPITIQIGPGENPLTFVFKFIDEEDTTSEDYRVEGEKTGERSLELRLYNFTNPLGIGTTQPRPVGTFQGKTLLMHYRVYDLEDSDKTLHYTFYVVEALEGGPPVGDG